MKYLKKFNEMLDPMGKWTPEESNTPDTDCIECGGTGRDDEDREDCEFCLGTGIEPKTKEELIDGQKRWNKRMGYPEDHGIDKLPLENYK